MMDPVPPLPLFPLSGWPITITTPSGGKASQVPLQATPLPVKICAFNVLPDHNRQLWYCDIEIDPGETYFPFVRLALARIKARLRRTSPTVDESLLEIDGLRLDPAGHRVSSHAQPVELGPTEYKLLEFLMRNTDRPLTRSLIIEHVWDIHFDSISNVVEVHIHSLRRKLGAELIRTVRGVGYMVDKR